MAERPDPHQSSYVHLNIGGKVAGTLLRGLSAGARGAGGLFSGLIGQISQRNKQVKKRAPSAPSGARPKPALPRSGQYGQRIPTTNKRVVLGRDVKVDKRLKELEDESPF